MNKKKGQTIVETVVALSILIIVLMGTITLIVNTTSLVLSARSRTEANAWAEKGLTEGVTMAINIKYPAGNRLLLDQTDSRLANCNDLARHRTCTVLKIDKTSAANYPASGNRPVINTSPTDITNSGYDMLEVISNVSWTDRLVGTQTVELRQLVRVH